jgi:amino acid transporter
MSAGKVLLMLGLFVFTFVVMLGGNPIKDRFGFRFWRDPGPISDFYGKTDIGRLRGFWSAVLNAAL